MTSLRHHVAEQGAEEDPNGFAPGHGPALAGPVLLTSVVSNGCLAPGYCTTSRPLHPRLACANLADHEGGNAFLLQPPLDTLGVIVADDHHEAYAHVEDAEHLR